MEIAELVAEAHENTVNKGFWEKPREFGTLIALVHSELSEALEGHRKGDMENVAEELADVLIRIGDLCGGLKINLQRAVEEKMLKNKGRPYKHGKVY